MNIRSAFLVLLCLGIVRVATAQGAEPVWLECAVTLTYRTKYADKWESSETRHNWVYVFDRQTQTVLQYSAQERTLNKLVNSKATDEKIILDDQPNYRDQNASGSIYAAIDRRTLIFSSFRPMQFHAGWQSVTEGNGQCATISPRPVIQNKI